MYFWIVTNFDEIFFHFIDCIHNNFQCDSKVEGITPPQLVSSDSLNNPVKNLSNGYQPPSSNPSYAQNSMDGLKDCDKLVLDYLQQHSDMSDGRGIHIDELSRGLKLPLDKIMSSLFFLFVSLCMSVPGTRDLTVAVYDDMLSQKTLGDDGLAYSTIDDFHYKQA
ncbi:hypothetical protein L6164_015830 [Bauhinia variegata]|uniref:Uncharacterized protein n=1 Tax=Bauhinia variegata TaxID=167791 RepID=A0ACB9NLG1_BAUVA|nr:hypothetical protein L6164_015830 [Bauhinia variegata]